LLKFVAFPLVFAQFERRMSSRFSKTAPEPARASKGRALEKDDPPPGQVTRVRVPGTTSNLGPGFDCLGCSLALWNEVTAWARAERESGEIHQNPFLREAAELFFCETGLPPVAFECRISGDVPRSRGLGSSATVRVGLMAALGGLYGLEPDRETLFRLCTKLEGHPDNAAPTVYGGFHACQGYLQSLQFEVDPALSWVLLIPDFEVLTAEARQVLPDRLDRMAAVETVAGACRVTAAFSTRQYHLLRGAFTDQLHQPYRQNLVPGMQSTIAAAENAGALGGFLSGSGSTLIAVTLENAEAVADAMRQAFPGAAETRIVSADNDGVKLLETPGQPLDPGLVSFAEPS
jgi:homoserine kinase